MGMNVETFQASQQKVAFSSPIPEHSTVCILDSSFNPPNLAHRKIAETCLERFPKSQLVLMLATGNADKPSVEASQLQHRVNMMEILGAEFPNCTIGLTTEPKFIAKARAVKADLVANKIVFAMGYDTLVRLGDQQYYTEPVSQVLKEFFSNTEVLVLTRNEDGVSKMPSLNKAAEQPNGIQKSSLWAPFVDKIHFKLSSKDTDGVSSSAARTSREQLAKLTPLGVAEYVLQHKLYGL